MDISNLKIKKLKKELFAAALSVGVAAVALGSSTYAWYVTNNTVDGTTRYYDIEITEIHLDHEM